MREPRAYDWRRGGSLLFEYRQPAFVATASTGSLGAKCRENKNWILGVKGGWYRIFAKFAEICAGSNGQLPWLHIGSDTLLVKQYTGK